MRRSRASRRAGLQPPLIPKRRGRFRVLGIARISGHNQDELSLEDQESLYRSYLNANLDLPYDLLMIAGRRKGEVLDSAAVMRAQIAGPSPRVMCNAPPG
jgi:hypothetical protein